MQAQLISRENRTPKILAQLIRVWESSVNETHHFYQLKKHSRLNQTRWLPLNLFPHWL